MKRFLSYLIILISSTIVWSQPLPVKTTHNVIIDSDCGIDDMRAISMMLARPEINIKAILLSDGSLSPKEGYEKINSLLYEFGSADIPVACGDINKGINPSWRQFNSQTDWGKKIKDPGKCPGAPECLTAILSNSDVKITLVALGPLTNIGQLIISHPSLLPMIERIIWYNESIKPLGGFNYECDRENAELVFDSRVRIDIISNLKKEKALFDLEMFDICKQSNTLLAGVIYKTYSQPAVYERLNQNHFWLWDDLVVLYLTNPELFDINTIINKTNVRYNQDYEVAGVREAISDMIKGTYFAGHNVVFNRFPDQREWFNYDIRPIIDSAISRYGYDEWKAIVMTDEFHGHLGIFSIVGAKMGIKAREIFGIGPDELVVTSYAGIQPPYSCLNDGIQVSTGATLGMGTIHLASDSITRPSAIFTYKKHSIQITLKKEYLEKVDADIDEGIVKFGLMDDGYWKLVRRNAIRYWLEWDRNKIFDITEVSQQP
jgi:pyrimidine-specific ribonucleoside hydrolase